MILATVTLVVGHVEEAVVDDQPMAVPQWMQDGRVGVKIIRAMPWDGWKK